VKLSDLITIGRERVPGSEHREAMATRDELARWTGEAGDAAALLAIWERVAARRYQ
jgi:hypothetical protein